MKIDRLQNTLVRALTEKQRLKIVYHGEERVVEVHAVGVSTKGNACARVYQVVGGAVFGAKTGWKMLVLHDIEEVEPVDEVFEAPRGGYAPGDRGMRSILAEL